MENMQLLDSFATNKNLKQNSSDDSNLMIINKYLYAMQTEINPSDSYKFTNTKLLTSLSRFHKGKFFTKMEREDVIRYLNSLRKPDDALHGWIGTYNLYRILLIRFFKWLYNPKLEPQQRPRPEVVQNIPKLKRKEISIYKPTDLWTLEDDLLFLKWCPNKRDRCYHAISRDLSARPHEMLSLRVKDIVFKQVGNKQYAEVLVNGKTGTRHLPLIDSLPYIKEWIDQHPQRNNPEAFFICSMDRRNFCKQLTVRGLYGVYMRYEKKYFPELLKDPTVPKEDKQNLHLLLRKPWNLYIRRHSALTQKSRMLKEHVLRQHAGWSPRSQMHLKYLHYYGNESSTSLLQEYGILPKNNEETDVLRSRQCPNCSEPNRPDQKFCVKCKLALTYEAWNNKEDELTALKKQMAIMQQHQMNQSEILKHLTPELLERIRKS